MRLSTLTRRSLAYHLRVNLAVAAGVIVGSAALTGALIVGDSMRESLREAALGRLGEIEYALTAGRFFPQDLADRIRDQGEIVAPVLLLRGSVEHADTHRRANGASVIGAEVSFDDLFSNGSKGAPLSSAGTAASKAPAGRAIQAQGIALGMMPPSLTKALKGRSNGLSAPFQGFTFALPLVTQGVALGWYSSPFQGFTFDSPLATQGVALGWYKSPFQGFLPRSLPLAQAKQGIALALIRLPYQSSDSPTLTIPAGQIENPKGPPSSGSAGVTSLMLEETKRRSGGAIVYGPPDSSRSMQNGQCIVNRKLADQLGAEPGDDVLIRLGRAGDVSAETIMGRRDQATSTLRVKVAEIIPDQRAGAFSLQPNQQQPANIYVALTDLQEAISQPRKINAMLVAPGEAKDGSGRASALDKRLSAAASLADFGLRVRNNMEQGYISLESDAFLLEPAVEQAAREAVGDRAELLLTYLANSIAVEHRLETGATQDDAANAIPYSTVTALDEGGLRRLPVEPGFELGSFEILLNHWAAEALSASAGDTVKLSYYRTGPHGTVEEHTHDFTVAGVVPLEGAAADPGYTPQYPGITDTEKLTDWDPPFPVDLKKISDRDEAYWDQHRATPKAFIRLEDGLHIWEEPAERFGRLTAIRVYPREGQSLSEAQGEFKAGILALLKPDSLGMTFEPVRARALEASGGSTDFGGLFVGFSFFLIASAAMLVALLFRLGVERRSREVGILLATGFRSRTVAWLLVTEGLIVAGVGSAIGLGAAIGYGWLMLTGLRGWWSAAVNAPFLQLHLSGTSLGIGYASGVLLGTLAIGWSIRGLTKYSVRSLLAGSVQSGRVTSGAARRSWAFWIMAGGFVAAVVLIGLAALTDAVSATMGFFGGGACALIGALGAIRLWLVRPQASTITRPDRTAAMRIGLRNAPRHVGRSTLTSALIACASFVIIALQAFRITGASAAGGKESGSGGFPLLAESTTPLLHDLNTATGRENLNMALQPDERLPIEHVYAFRVRPGDETSCLNLYKPVDPRIVGAPPAFMERGGFAFSATMAETDKERENPWLLLNREFEDGAVPVIGDEAAVKWQLHLGLGRDLQVTDDRGRTSKLRFVALLAGSVLQSEVVVSDAAFTDLFGTISGYSFFLIDVPAGETGQATELLERELAPYGFDVVSTAQRLDEYFAVQNTYLSTFQVLGGLGLALGVVGLSTVLLRNVWERRGELALLQAIGYSRRSIGWIVLSENAALLLMGLAAGVLPALLAVAPHAARQLGSVPWGSMGAIIGLVLAIGMLAGILATASALRLPLIASLRRE